MHWIGRISGNIWNPANNHVMDCREEGLDSTLETARSRGRTVGTGENVQAAQEPVILKEAGGFGMYAQGRRKHTGLFHRRPGGTDSPGLREIKKTCRWCVVVSHAGHEFGQMPLPYPRNRYLEYGADVVVGHYPRVVQNYETVGEKIIFYSLGKFIFDTDYQRAQRHTEYGMLVRLSFGEGSFTWGHLPTRIHRESRTIDAGPCPAIFRDIQPGQCRLLWPLAAWDLCRNERVKYAFNKPELRGYSRWDWLLKWEIGRCKTDQGRDTMRSRIRSLLQLWRLADREVVAYIRGR